MASNAEGAQARLCAEPGSAPHTFDGSSEPYDFLYETLQKRGRIVGGNQIRGTREQSQERTRLGAYPVGGRVAMNVSPLDLDNWLPRILGANEATNVFALAETLPSFGVLVDRVTQTFEYKDCMVDYALLKGTAGPGDGNPDLLELVLGIVGKDEATGTSYPSLTLGTAAANAPYVFSDASTLTLAGSSTRYMKSFKLLIQNFVQTRWVNSITATRLTPRDRMITLDMVVPYDTDHSNLYGQALAGAAATLTFANGSYSTSFSFGTLQVPSDSPFVRGKTEIDLTLRMVARKTGSTASLSVTNVSS